MKKKELQSIDYIKERADENLAKTKSVFLYRRELAIRLALRQKEFTQNLKLLSELIRCEKHLAITIINNLRMSYFYKKFSIILHLR